MSFVDGGKISSEEEDDDEIQEVGAQVKRVYKCKICQDFCASVFEFVNHFNAKHRKSEEVSVKVPLSPPSSQPQEIFKPGHAEGFPPAAQNEKLTDSIEAGKPSNEEIVQDTSTEKSNDASISNDASSSENCHSPEILHYLGLTKECSPVKESVITATTGLNYHYHCLKCPMKFATNEVLRLHTMQVHLLPTALAEASTSGAQIRPTNLEADTNLYCVCKETFNRDMIGCDNKRCKLKWFHFDCVGVTSPPEGKWYCPTCTKQRKRRQATESSKVN